MTLTELIRRLLKEVPDLKRLRISSIEVTEVSEELISLMKEEPRIARHLHIPLQSGCDETLKRMGRPYGIDAYYDKIKWIREQLGDIAISCDLIVGFAGESEEEFQKTLAFCEKCEFAFRGIEETVTAVFRLDTVRLGISQKHSINCNIQISNIQISISPRFNKRCSFTVHRFGCQIKRTGPGHNISGALRSVSYRELDRSGWGRTIRAWLVTPQSFPT